MEQESFTFGVSRMMRKELDFYSWAKESSGLIAKDDGTYLPEG
jgi:hypothetical protein